MEASDIDWLYNYDLAYFVLFYHISIYITCLYEFECLKVTQLCREF
jgi:hypothetical protein